MKTKKIFAAALAGLCAVSAMGVSAFAADTTTKVEAAGEKAYKISAGFEAPTMDVTVPTEIKGVINPYKINVVKDGLTFESEGVASPRYAITNNSSVVGVKVNATYSADGLDGIVATEAAATTGNTKGQKLAYVTLNAALGTDAAAETTKVMSTEEATANEILKLDAAGGTNPSGEIWLGGAVIETPAEKWTTKDKLTINVVLDLVPYSTGAGGGGGSFTATVAKSAIDFSADTAYVLGNLTADDTYALTIDIDSAANLIPAFTDYTITSVSSTDDTVVKTQTTGGAAIKYALQPQDKGTCEVTYTLTDDNSGDTVTVTFAIEVTGA